MNKFKKPIHYSRHEIDEDDLNSVLKVLKSPNLTQGPMVTEFEESISDYVKCRFAVATSNATSSLYITYRALGLSSGKLLWTTANTFVATSNAAIICGAEVDFIDIDTYDFNLDIEALEVRLKKAEKVNKTPDIVTVVHFAGNPFRHMNRLHELSLKYDFEIVEDASHALGAGVGSENIGSCRFSAATIFSFHPVKPITTGEGGMVCTNNAALAQRLRSLSTHGVSSSVDFFDESAHSEIWNYQQWECSLNFRLSDLCAALGVSQLKKLDSFIDSRRAWVDRYEEFFRSHGLPIANPQYDLGVRHSYHLYPCLLEDSSQQKPLYLYLRERNVYVNVHYIPVYLHPFYRSNYKMYRGYCPKAEDYFSKVLTFPLHQGLRETEFDFICNSLLDFFHA